MVDLHHPELGDYEISFEPSPALRELLFTENETNAERVFGVASSSKYTKDAFHRRVVDAELEATNPERKGTKVAAWYEVEVPARGRVVIQARLRRRSPVITAPFGTNFERSFRERKLEADAFYARVIPETADPAERAVARQAMVRQPFTKIDTLETAARALRKHYPEIASLAPDLIDDLLLQRELLKRLLKKISIRIAQ